MMTKVRHWVSFKMREAMESIVLWISHNANFAHLITEVSGLSAYFDQNINAFGK